MDLDQAEVFALLKDPKTKDETMKRIMDNVKELKDENGEVCKVVYFKDSNMAMSMIAFMEMNENIWLHDIRKFPVREDDIFVLDYPKSGTHWLLNLINLMLQKDKPLDTTTLQEALLEVFSEEFVEKLPSPRILASHCPPKSIPQEIFSKRSKAILLYRNPKDTAVSLYHNLKKMPGFDYKISWNCHVENWMSGKAPANDYFCHYNAWDKLLKERKDVDVLVICFENLKKTPVKELQKVNKYLGLKLSDERLQEIIERCSLSNLKHDAESGAVKTHFINEAGKSVLYRKGIIGDWKNYFTVAQNERIDEIIKAKFSPDSIFKFQYE